MIGMHKHKKPNGTISSDFRPAPNGMHSHDNCSTEIDVPGHTHTEIATGESTGPRIDRVPEPDKQRI